MHRSVDRWPNCGRSGKGHGVMRGTIDIDSFPIEVHGKQEGGNHNGYYRKTTYHPLVASFCVAEDSLRQRFRT
jgi:hypothetical protein